MRLTQSASVSPSERGSGNRLGARTRKKHKRLDAITEDVFNRNRSVETGSNEGSGRGECGGNDDSELRRSSRVRRVPEVLDSSPPPKRKRRKIDRFGRGGGRGGSREGLRGKGKVENEAGGLDSGSSEEELGARSGRGGGRGGSRGGLRGKGKVENEAGESDSGSSEEELGARSGRGGGRGGSRGGLRGKGKVENEAGESDSGSSEEELGARSGRGGGRGGSRGVLREKGKVDNEAGESDVGSSEEELEAWRSRLKGIKSRGKRKLFLDVEDDEEEVRSVKDDLENSDGEKSGGEEDTKVGGVEVSIDGGNKIVKYHVVGERLVNAIDDFGSEEVGDDIISISGRADVNELILDGGCVNPVEKENEVPADIMREEKVDMKENSGEGSQTDDPVNSSELVHDAENHCLATEADALPTDVAENGKKTTKEDDVEVDVRQKEHEDVLTVKNCSATSGGIPRPRIKEGRRCGLCGGGTDGKPPKRLVTDSGGSDNEAYSGSSGSEEYSYDAWDGFGDESGWLGKLLGPVNDRHGIAGIWVHLHCAVWSPEVYFAGLGCLKNIRAALCRGRALKCTRCGRPGATLGCRVDRCPRTYHMPCARATGCIFDHRKFLIACADHRYLFEPYGNQHSQHIKKLKAKKMKMEIRKISNDASRKDLEAEEKWLDKCGEDEEFLRRETKRLQRDVLRIAPVYIGGSQSEGEHPFDGWESVAGLQGVVQCMKEVVILPLLYPEFFQNMGITPPRGVLMHGYPGTGKTLAVRALIGACARGDKRIAYFARKGADCLGKYVGDAERQLRLLFQVAEKSQPSIIFFDEIDGLAPVRTRQQDQTHSSVVSTLLALMDGLKSRGSVIVIGATNRPDSVDPALRRPGRFDREIYFPLPSVKDRAAILALHTKKWPKPVAGPLLEWVATKTLGFAGADLQALCSQAAVIALKRNCSWHQILSCAGENPAQGRRPKLPSFVVEERDWLEALSLAPPPCSRREAGMAANEVLGFPLDVHLVPCLLQPLLSLIVSLYLDDRLWLPHCLITAARAIKIVVVSEMEKKNLQNDKWWCCAQNIAKDPNTAREIVKNLCLVGIIDGDASLTGCDISKDISSDDDAFHQCSFGDNPSGLLRNVCYAPSKKTGYRIMISGVPRAGQKHLASCFLKCFMGNIEIQKIDLATISQEGHGNMEQGISRILMRCASLNLCAIFMPRIDLWAIELSAEQDVVTPALELSKESSLTFSQAVNDECSFSTPELVREPESQSEICHVSKPWKSFREQLECLCASSSLIILATSEVPCAALPIEVRQFFGSEPLASEGSFYTRCETRRFSVEVNGDFDRDKLIHLSAIDLSMNLIQQFVHVAHLESHQNSGPSITRKVQFEDQRDISTPKSIPRSVEESGTRKELSEDPLAKLQVPSVYKNVKEKSTLVQGVTTFGYQILRYPHFAELCWVTSKLNEGPSADIRGPWKGWPFNSCIVRPCQLVQKDAAVCNSNNLKKKDKFTLVRGLVAVGLSAYRGVYKSSREVSFEVRKVLELLVGQIGTRIQAGKDRLQYIRLLSQVAYLEDMVINWSHSLRSLEPEDQTKVMICKPSGEQSPENPQAPTVEAMRVEEDTNTTVTDFQEKQLATGGMLGSPAEGLGGSDLNAPADGFQNPEFVEEGFQGSLVESSRFAVLTTEGIDVGLDNKKIFELELVEGGFQKSLTESSQLADLTTEAVNVNVAKQIDSVNIDEMSPEKAVSGNHMAAQSVPAGEGINQDSPDELALASNPAAGSDIADTATIDRPFDVMSYESCRQYEFSTFKNVEDPTISQVTSADVLDQEMAANCKNVTFETPRPSELCSQSSPGPVLRNEIFAEAENHRNDIHLPDLNLSRESSEMTTKSEVICCYSCCTGCISTLQQLVKKLVIGDWELSGSCSTVEDVHDIVSSLSTRLSSAVRNLYVTGECRSPINGEQSSEFSRKSESQETNSCQCRSSECRSTKLMNCVCHSEDVPGEWKPSSPSYDQPRLHSRYIFRDGVLVSSETDEESSVHCKYETLCLCSLIELIVSTKQPLD